MIKKIDHIAIAVNNLDEQVVFYRDILGLKFLGVEEVPEQKVKVGFFDVNGVHIELLEPLSADSPISGFLEKKGGGIHHIAYEVDNIRQQIADFKEKEIRMLNSEPRQGAHNAQIAFGHPKSFSGVLVELTQKDEEKK